MKLKTLVVTVVILAALSAIVFWTNRAAPAPPADPRVGQPMVAPSDVEKAAALRFSDQGKTIVLTRGADGAWSDTSYFDLPADFSKLSSFVGDVTAAKIDRLVTANPESIARLDFKDTKIELLDPAGHAFWSVTVGKNADSGGRFVRFGDEPKAYLATLNAYFDVDPKDWANMQLLDVKPETVAKADIDFAQGGPIALTRTKAGDAWTADGAPAGKKVDADKVSALLTSLGTLRFSDTSDLADPLVAAAKPYLRTFRLTTFDGKTLTIAVGRTPEKKTPKKPDATPLTAPEPAKNPAATAAAPVKDEPLFDTTPAGPVYVFITSSDEKAPVNALMKKRAFQVEDYVFTSLPDRPDDIFEAPPPPPAPAPAAPSPPPAGTAK